MFRIYIFFLLFIIFTFGNIYCSNSLNFLMRKSCHDNDYYKAIYFLYKINYKSRYFFNLNCLLILCHFEKFDVVTSVAKIRSYSGFNALYYKREKKKKYYNKARKTRTLAILDLDLGMHHKVSNYNPIKNDFLGNEEITKELEKIDYDHYFSFSNRLKKRKIKEDLDDKKDLKKIDMDFFLLMQEYKEKEVKKFAFFIKENKLDECNDLNFIDKLLKFEKTFYVSSNLKKLKKHNYLRAFNKNNDISANRYKKVLSKFICRNTKSKIIYNKVDVFKTSIFVEKKVLSCMYFLLAAACYKQSVFYYSFFNGNIYNHKYVLRAVQALENISVFPVECVSMNLIYIKVSKMLRALSIKKILYYYSNKAYYPILIETAKRDKIFLYSNSFYFFKSLNEINLDAFVKIFLDVYPNEDEATFLGFDKMYADR